MLILILHRVVTVRDPKNFQTFLKIKLIFFLFLLITDTEDIIIIS